MSKNTISVNLKQSTINRLNDVGVRSTKLSDQIAEALKDMFPQIGKVDYDENTQTVTAEIDHERLLEYWIISAIDNSEDGPLKPMVG